MANPFHRDSGPARMGAAPYPEAYVAQQPPAPYSHFQYMPGPGPQAAPGPAYPPPPPPPPTNVDSTGRRDAALEGRKLFIGGIAVTGIDSEIIRYDFGKFGEIEDVFVPADRNEPGKIRGIAFVTYKDAAVANMCVREMHGRNYHGREITCNVAKPRGPDPKKDGTFHNSDRYSGKYDAGGRLRPEFRNSMADPNRDDSRYDRPDASDAEREREYRAGIHTSGNSYDGSGRYGDRDPRPVQAYYD